MEDKNLAFNLNESFLEYFFKYTHDGIVLLDRDFNFVRVNQAYADACKRGVEEFPGHNHFEFYPSPLIEDFRKVVETGVPYAAFTRPFVFPDHPEWGETYWDLSLVPIRNGSGEIEFLLFTLKDVTERQRAMLALHQSNRHLRAVVACNSLIIHASSESALLKDMCRLIVETGGYLMSWVGFAEQDENKSVRPVAESGYEDGYLDSLNVTWADTARGRGPTGAAIRTGLTQVNQNCLTNPLMEPWRESALKRGYQSSIALPLVEGGKAFGALTIYSKDPHAFDRDEVEMLEEMTKDLSFGILALRSSSARRKAEEELRRSEERYRLVLDNAADSVLIADPAGKFVYANQQAGKMLGYDAEELLEMGIREITPPEEVETVMAVFSQVKSQGRIRVELKQMRKNGSVFPVELNAVLLPDGNYYGACRDITERQIYETQLEYQSTHDALTGLANRILLNDRIEQSVVHSRRVGRWVATMLIDLDRFKLINDSLGHEVGDKLLSDVAKRLSENVRTGDTVARLGGDEFMVVMSDLSSEDDAVLLARHILDVVSQPTNVTGHEIVATASIGVSLYPRDGAQPSILLQNAEVAMYRAKESGRNSFQFYAPEMNARALEKFELENSLRHALEHHELELYYQPKVSFSGQHIAGAEALIRWNHPDMGLIFPGDFIAIAEETGLIVPIGEWVIHEACRQIGAWRDEGLPKIPVAVNISARQFQRGSLAKVTKQALLAYGIQAQYLEIEVTESAAMSNPDETLAILKELKGIGIRISLDDFGTGYSSLNYLKRFPVDSLKIDQSFVRDITTNHDDAAISKLIISLAHGLNQKVIAEGVETKEQFLFLQQESCDEMQGYYFSKPIPAAEFAALLKSRT